MSDEGSRPIVLVSFADPNEVTRWHAIDDVVMGGCSSSAMSFHEGIGVFSGTVSLANRGGFASVRREPADAGLSCSSPSPEAFVLRVRGDGRRYQFRLRTDDGFDGISYGAAMSPPADRWTEQKFSMVSFEPVFRGRPVPGAPALSPGRVRQFSLMITDRQPGMFRLEIEWIAVQR